MGKLFNLFSGNCCSETRDGGNDGKHICSPEISHSNAHSLGLKNVFFRRPVAVREMYDEFQPPGNIDPPLARHSLDMVQVPCCIYTRDNRPLLSYMQMWCLTKCCMHQKPPWRCWRKAWVKDPPGCLTGAA